MSVLLLSYLTTGVSNGAKSLVPWWNQKKVSGAQIIITTVNRCPSDLAHNLERQENS